MVYPSISRSSAPVIGSVPIDKGLFIYVGWKLYASGVRGICDIYILFVIKFYIANSLELGKVIIDDGKPLSTSSVSIPARCKETREFFISYASIRDGPGIVF